ncbi:NHL repeat protein [Salpingoeca rosetta]|uniref:NHL repeat protein n=1 Tax=Salpingoeca rosetta (strain ATCC 50818 / BSB-021) TaxID=946362 RepID=F2U400_SALR5|nr:NHL repeat protein [Salpingoeca rosetta]EGD82344.1 NHL repeat protein [Salpingoeca rosetta]|eukprot:XP_004996527.1 NHL repeat protein [Salpingoeca rosetta]
MMQQPSQLQLAAWCEVALLCCLALATVLVQGTSDTSTSACNDGAGLTSLASVFSENDLDRSFNFHCQTIGTGTTTGVSVSGPYDAQLFRRDTSFRCPDNHYLSSVESQYSPTYVDRLFRFRCHRPASAILRDCRETDALNKEAQSIMFEAGDSRVIAGMLSQPTNYDRIYKFITCKVECDVSNNFVLTSNGLECTRLRPSVIQASVAVNEYKGAFFATCPEGQGIHLLSSDFSSSDADRPSFTCYLWAAFRYIAGLSSSFDEATQDRVWAVTACQVSCADDFVPDGDDCTPTPCPELTFENGQVSGDCHGRVGDTCVYSQCNDGFVLRPGQQSRTCQSDGTWSGSVPRCIPVFCPQLAIQYGKLTGSCSGNFGDVCFMDGCESGYMLTGNTAVAHCGYDGWTADLPTCQPATCPPIAILNGQTDGCDGDVGGVCTLSCNHGFILSDGSESATLRCRQEYDSGPASWVGPTHVDCIRASCDPLTLENGSVSGDCDGSLGGVCRYESCDNGYRLSASGTRERLCQLNGVHAQWSGAAKTCERLHCPSLVDTNGVQNGTCTNAAVPGDTCSLSSCDSGYWQSDAGAFEVTCVAQGDTAVWDGQLKSCERVSCTPLVLNYGSTLGQCAGNIGDVCYFGTCYGDHFLTPGDPSRQCVQNEDSAYWSGDARTCQATLRGRAGQDFTLQCPDGQGFVSVKSESSGYNADKRIMKFGCADVGSNDANRVWKSYRVDKPLQTFDFTCPDNYYLYGVETEYIPFSAPSPPRDVSDRVWTFNCAILHGAELSDCQTSQHYAADDYTFDFAAPNDHVLVGFYSEYHTGDIYSRSFIFRTCKVTCNVGEQYESTAGPGCQRIGCGPLTLDDGTVSGECDGHIGDECEYVQCDSGYKLSASGSDTRKCTMTKNGKPTWSGKPKTCEVMTTTTPEPNVVDLCDAYVTAANPATCHARCEYYNKGAGTFTKQYGNCNNVCACGCGRRFRLTRDEEACTAHCDAQELQGIFREMHLGCRQVCLCVEGGVTSTTSPGGVTGQPSPGAAFDFPFADYHYELTFTGNVNGATSNARQFSTAVDAYAIIVNMEAESVLQCLRYCDAEQACLGVVIAPSDEGAFRCQLMRDLGTDTGEPTSEPSVSLTKGTRPPAVSTTTPASEGVVQTVAGDGSTTWSAGGAPTTTGLNRPVCVTFDGEHEMLVTMVSDHRVIRVDLRTRTSSLVAGTGEMGASGVGGAATSAQLNRPRCAIADVEGNVYITEEGNHRVSIVDVASKKLIVGAGTGNPGHRGMGGTPGNAAIHSPVGLAWADDGSLLFSDEENHVVYMVNRRSLIISVVAGTPRFAGYSGDDGLSIGARLNRPRGIALSKGVLYIADSGNHRIRAVDMRTQVITTVAGTGSAGFSGDGGLPTNAALRVPHGVAVHSSGTLAIADSGNHRVRVFNIGSSTAGVIETITGDGEHGYNGDNAATASSLNFPTSVTFSARTGNVVFADTRNNRIRQVWQ